MLAFRLLLRNWRSGELKLLSAALMLAVAVLSGISVFTNRLDTSMRLQRSAMLGADLQIESPSAIPPEWAAQAGAAGVRHSQSVSFESMLYAGDEMALASVKAVSAGFPLRGEAEISDLPFATGSHDVSVARGIPAPGEVWLNSRLVASLHLRPGDPVQVGERQLRFSKVLIREPDQFSLNPRLLMNDADLVSTGVVQPGARLSYRFLLASDDTQRLNALLAQLSSQLTPGQEVMRPEQMLERIRRIADNGKQFLLLSTIIAVLLAGVAIAIAARQFAERHSSQVAMMKCLGVSAARIRRLYVVQLLLLSVMATLAGLACGQLIQELVAQSLQQVVRFKLSAPAISPYVLSFSGGILCVMFFALPAMWFLPAVSPLKILRRELKLQTAQLWMQALSGLIAILLLIALFSADLRLTAIFSGGLSVLILVAMLLTYLLMALSRLLMVRLQGSWRLAFANIYRRQAESLMQMLVFSIAIMALLVLTIVRSSVMEEWRASIPAGAANHFLLNIAPDEVSGLKAMLDQQQIRYQPFYPSLRARIAQINGKTPDAAFRKKSRTLQIENDVSWTADLMEGDQITEGKWWGQWQRGAANLPGVSVGADSAKKMGLRLGDRLRFSVEGYELEAEVASFRQITPSATRNSFAFLFEPQAMQSYTASYSTGFYLPAAQKSFVLSLLHKYPNLLLLELDRMFSQMKTTIQQVTDAVLLVLCLSVVAGALVLLSVVSASTERRRQENGLLRALGSPAALIAGSIFKEFAVLGALAGSVAVISGELILAAIQTLVLQLPVQAHYLYWLLTPLGSAVLLATLGSIACRQVITTPPSVILRGASAS